MRTAAIVSVLLLILAAATVVMAEGEQGGGDANGLDHVVAEIVRMLDEKVGDDLISDWLERSGERPGEVGPDELIALSRAGASEDLINKLVDLVQVSVETALEATEETPVRALPSGTAIQVEFSIDYDPEMVEYQAVPWDLYVYLDGSPLGWVDGWSSHTAMHSESLSFHIDLSPGKHVIRVFQEQHTLRSRRRDTWNHAARVYARPMVLDLDVAGSWRVDIAVREKGSFFGRRKAPMEYAILRDGKVVESGPAADAGWPDLCEEVLTAFPEEKERSKTARKALKGCLSWDSLWEGLEDVPGREAVRDMLKAVDYRPVPVTR